MTMTMTFKHYPKAQIVSDWEALMALSADEAIDLHLEWEDIAAHNERVRAHYDTMLNNDLAPVIASLEALGINVYRSKKNGTFLAWFEREVVEPTQNKLNAPIDYVATPHIEHNATRTVHGVEVEFEYLSKKGAPDLIDLYFSVEGSLERAGVR